MMTATQVDAERRFKQNGEPVPPPGADPQPAPPDIDEMVPGGEVGGSISFKGAGASLGKAFLRSRRTAPRRIGRLVREAARITTGTSDVAPAKSDARFRDPTWRDNPVYRRVMQTYLATCAELETLIDDASLSWRDEERARFLMTILTTAVGNPAALKRAFETGGASAVRGLRTYARDLVDNGGMPRTADRRPFTLGVNLAASKGAVIYRDEVVEVLQFEPTTACVHERPVLLVPPPIGKYYFMDLAPGRSFIEHAVSKGLQFFTISWRNVSSEQGHWDFDTYGAALLRAVDAVREVTRSPDVNLIGLCAGGLITSTVLSHLAQNDDDRVHTASFGVTLLDFSVRAPMGAFDATPLLTPIRFRTRRKGVMDSRSMGSAFTWMRPDDLVWKYWVNNYLMGEDPPAFDILAWNADGTNLPGTLHRQFLDTFQNNLVARPGAMTVLDTPVDLSKVEMETYVTGALTDHLTPWKGCYQTTQLMSGPSTFVLSSSGHIASLVNPPGNPKSHYFAGGKPGPDPEAWRATAERHQGTWWEHWTDWVLERSGAEEPAPTSLGSDVHPAQEAAPGLYVRGLESLPA
jgi:polyhydroxyalkanoate synthase